MLVKDLFEAKLPASKENGPGFYVLSGRPGEWEYVDGPFETSEQAATARKKQSKYGEDYAIRKLKARPPVAEGLTEAKGEYNSFKSWKAAVKKKNPEAWIEGDEDIAQAMVGPKPYKHGETKSIGEWDGAKGELFEGVDRMQNARNQAEIGRGPSARDFKDEYEPVLKAHGFKKKPSGVYYKTAGFGEITINKHGHWEHLHVGNTDADKDFEGTTAKSLDRHLSSLNEAKAPTGPRFRVSWKGYGKTAPKVVGLEFFADDNGFDSSDIKAIKALGVGEDHSTGGPHDSVTITRTK